MKLHAMIAGALLLATTTLGQTNNEIAKVKQAIEFQSDKTNQEFFFLLPENITVQNVQDAYIDYGTYFTYSFEADNHVLHLNLTNGTNEEKFFVHRMLAAMRIQFIEQDGNLHSIRDFSLNQIEQ